MMRLFGLGTHHKEVDRRLDKALAEQRAAADKLIETLRDARERDVDKLFREAFAPELRRKGKP